MQKSVIAILTIASILAAFGQLFFKIGATGRVHPLEFINIKILIGFILYGAGSALWVYAMSFEKLSRVYPFTALTFVLVMAISASYLDEKITANVFVGLICVLIGLALISYQN